MPFLELDLSDTKETELIPADTEVKLRVVSVKQDLDKNGNAYIMPLLEPVEYPYANLMNYFMGLPHPEMEARQLNATKLKLKSFFDAVGVDPNGVDLENLRGEECWAIVGIEDSDYGRQNKVKRFVVGN